MNIRFACVLVALLAIVACSSTYNPNEALIFQDVKIGTIPGFDDRVLVIEAISPVAREMESKSGGLLIMPMFDPPKKLEDFALKLKKGDKIYVKYNAVRRGCNMRTFSFKEIIGPSGRYQS